MKPLLYLLFILTFSVQAQVLKESIRLDISDGLDQNTVFAVTEDSLGAIWIGTPGGLHRYNGNTLIPMHNIEETVLDLHSLGRHVYCLTIEGMHRIDISNQEVVRFKFPQKDYFRIKHCTQGIALFANIQDKSQFLDYDLNAISMPDISGLNILPNGDKHGSIVTTAGEFVANPQGAFIAKNGDTTFITRSYSSQMVRYGNRIFIGTHEGLWEVQTDDEKFISKLVFDDDRIECLFVDNNGNLWLGSSAKGIYMFHRNALNSEFHAAEDPARMPIPCWAIFETPTETFVGTNDGVRAIRGNTNHELVLKTKGISCYTGIHGDGFTLIGTASDGVYRYSPEGFRTEFFNNKDALDNTIVCIIQNEFGYLACSKMSFIQFDKRGKFKYQKSYKEVPMSSYAMWIQETHEGYICASTTGVCWLGKDLSLIRMVRHDNARVFNMCIDSVCVSMDGGLYKLQPDSTLLQSVFPDNQLLSIIDHEWISSTNAVYQITPNGIRTYSYENGFPLREYNQGGHFKDEHQRVMFAGIGGVFKFHPDSVESMPSLPKVSVAKEGLLYQNSQIIQLPYDQGFLNLSIEPIVLSDHNLFEIVAITNGDTILITEPKIQQLKLAYGSSHLQTQVKNVYNGEVSTQIITIERAFPFWMKWWFLALSIVVLILLLLGLFSALKFFQTKRLLRSQQAENKVNQERLRISKELHDNIGARLTHIISSLDIEMYKSKSGTQGMESINAFARETMSQLRETIWAVSDKTIFLSEFILRVEQYIEQSNELTRANLSTDIQSDIDFELNPIQTINYFRIVQEAVNNALKYAHAKSIRVSISHHDGIIDIRIVDDGDGFDIHSTRMGTGVKGMKARAEEAQAKFSIESSPGKGTMAILIFDIE